MKTFEFDIDIGIVLNNSKSFVVLDDLEALVNKIEQRLQFFLAEWFLDITQGIAYFQQIFENPVDPGLIVSLINDDISKEPDVTQIKGVSIQYDSLLRSFSYSSTIDTSFGTTQISGGVQI